MNVFLITLFIGFILSIKYSTSEPDKFNIKSSISQDPLSVKNCILSIPITINIIVKININILFCFLNKSGKKKESGIKAHRLPIILYKNKLLDK